MEDGSDIKALLAQVEELSRALKASEAVLAQAKAALTLSQEKYQKVLDHAPVLVALTDLTSGAYVEVNEEACRRSGFTRSEVLGHTATELGWLSAEQRRILVEDLQSGRAIRDREMSFRCKDGSSMDGLFNGEVIVLDGRPHLLTVTTDITERVRATTTLDKELKRRRVLFDESPDGIVIIEPQTTRFLEFNAQAHLQLGYSREQFAALTLRDIDAFESEEEIRAHIDLVIQRGKSDFETVQRTHLGELRNIHVTAQWIEADGQGIYHCVWRDITARVAAEARRAAAEAERTLERRYFEGLFESVPGPAYVVDVNGRFLRRNGYYERVLGFSPSELEHLTAYDIVVPEDRELLRQGIAAVHEHGHGRVEVQLLTSSGTAIAHDCVGVLLVLDGVSLVIGVGFDVSDRKTAEQERQKLRDQLNQLQKMESIGRLAGGVAHDFNNMLGVILGHVELAMEDVPVSSPVRADLEQIQKAAHRSADLTRQLLAFARKQAVAPKVLDLNETVAAMLKMLGRLMGEDISLTWTPGDDIAPVRIDPAQVDQILANLCVNARDAINHDRGNIVIETRMADVDADYCEQHLDATPGRYVVLSVSDNGTGMSGETLQHIFEPFFTTKEVGAGTGLGLATVYGAVKQNSGFVTVYSELGVGTTFHVFLPEMLERCSFASAYASVGPMSGDETILLVEDEPAMLSMTRAMLVRLGYRVIAASTPLEAIHTFEQLTEPLDLLITDVVMPQMNGRELAQRLKVRQPNLRCIYCSGYTARLIAHHGILDADVNLLLKPFSSAQLASMVRAVLQA